MAKTWLRSRKAPPPYGSGTRPPRTKTLTQTRNVSGAKGSTFLLSLWGKGQGIPTTAGVVQVQVLLYNGATLVQAKTITFPNSTYGFTREDINLHGVGFIQQDRDQTALQQA